MKKIKEQGFLYINNNGIIKINHKKTNSILLNRLQLDFLIHSKKYLKGNLLDAGCGEKPYCLLYDNLVKSSIGIDVKTCTHEQKYVDIFASIDDMPFEDEKFDTILCTNVLEHVSDLQGSYEEMSRVLKKNGYLVMSIPFLYPIHEEPYDFYRYTRYGLISQLGKNGFEVEKIYPWGGYGLFMAVYFNLFICKFLKSRVLNYIFANLQEIYYYFYNKLFFHKILKGFNRVSKVLTTGYFVIAKKK